jgi:hypothetical protein
METLRLCRQHRNKVLHSDFRAARDKLNELGVETPSGRRSSTRSRTIWLRRRRARAGPLPEFVHERQDLLSSLEHFSHQFVDRKRKLDLPLLEAIRRV